MTRQTRGSASSTSYVVGDMEDAGGPLTKWVMDDAADAGGVVDVVGGWGHGGSGWGVIEVGGA